LKEESSTSLDEIKNIQVSSVDGFQGEENDIIILSLVRSSEYRGIGFLNVSNRGEYSVYL
jgi:superfamily I DNA and/or RNA helicase